MGLSPIFPIFRLSPASWCLEVPNGGGNVVGHTKTGPCTYNTLRGDVTQIGTQWVQVKPTASSTQGTQKPDGPDQHDSRCIFVKEKVKSASGNAVWNPIDGDVAQNNCNDYCAAQLAADKAQGKIGSATCFKNDGKPWVDDQGNEPSGILCTNMRDSEHRLTLIDASPVGTKIYGVGQCVCDWPLINTVVDDVVTKALPAIGEVSTMRYRIAVC